MSQAIPYWTFIKPVVEVLAYVIGVAIVIHLVQGMSEQFEDFLVRCIKRAIIEVKEYKNED